MNTNHFIENYRNAFGDSELPVGIWYSNEPVAEMQKTKGCFIKDLKPAREGKTVSLSLETISCFGGKVYTGFMEMPPFLPGFVSQKEHYKQSPGLVSRFVNDLNIRDQSGKCINFVTIDQLDSFDGLEGLVFFATPYISGDVRSFGQAAARSQYSEPVCSHVAIYKNVRYL